MKKSAADRVDEASTLGEAEEIESPENWQSRKETLAERARYLSESGQWSDCRFMVGEEPSREIVRGHKLLLAMSSPVFATMFFGSMPEESDPIPIPDVRPEVFRALVSFVYTDRVKLRSFQVAAELFYCAKKYMLPFLATKCADYIKGDLSPERVCGVYEFAKLFEETELLEEALSVLRLRTNEILREASWEQVQIGTISALLEENTLEIESEIDLFEALLRWSRAECERKSLSPSDPTSLRSVVGGLIGKIRFLTLTPQEFADGPGKSELLTKDEAFAVLMNISSNVGGVAMPEGFSTETSHRRAPKPEREPPLSLHDWAVQEHRAYQLRREEEHRKRTSEEAIDGARTLKDLHAVRYIGETTIRESSIHYCRRIKGQSTICLNHDVLDCSVTFRVDKTICLLGVTVPTQTVNLSARRTTTKYTEILYAYLLDSNGSRVTYTHFTTAANCNSTVEVNFNRPVYVQKNKIYRIGVVFNKAGTYPISESVKEISCRGVHFAFCVGRSVDSVRDGLIKDIVFS